MKYSFLLITVLFLFINGNSNATGLNRKSDNLLQLNSGALKFHAIAGCHPDSIHKFNFRYPDKRRGLKPYIIPAALTTTGTALAFSKDIKENVRDFAQEHLAYSGRLDDYIQYAPLAAVYTLNAAGIKGKNNFGNRTAIAVKSVLLREIIVTSLKGRTKVRRPNGDMRAFPSGHASFAFAMAHFMHKEYGEKSYWYSFGAYSAAASVSFMRVARNAHWVSDVTAGAGIGMLCTELIYLTHQYKWDWQHLKNLDIFPFQAKHQKGIAFVYTF
ncbi:MAG: phosphatase PAP2 family protein [Prolixibacteraceae bacterium]